jgi:NADPH-dependent curcumin reductase CurA
VKGVEIHLASRPTGTPTLENFRFVTVDVPAPGPGQVVVRNLVLSVDPYMRGRMNDVKSYVPPFRLDEVMEGTAVGEVVVSESPGLRPGDMVLHQFGWREYAVADAKRFRKVDPTAAPSPSAYLGVLGMPGLTAYVGLLDIAAMKPGDTVFVSGAAGAVGSLAGQIAKLRGAARVIGSAGSPAKVARLLDLGFDAAFDYHAGPVRAALKQAAPEGIDVYFDNVGGKILDVVLGQINERARIVMCGAISQYNTVEPPPGPRNLFNLVPRRGRMEGFIVLDYLDRFLEAILQMGQWVEEGRIRYKEEIVDGLERAPAALRTLFTGENTGKLIVRVADG